MKRLLSYMCAFVLLTSMSLSCQVVSANSEFEITATSSKNSVKIKWYKVSGAKHYKVYRKTQSKKYKLVKKTEKRVFVDEKLKSNKKYFYKVKAFKKNKKGKFYCFKTGATSTKTYNRIIDEPIQNINYPPCLENLTAESKNSDRKKEIDNYNKKFYISEDAPDFEITDYKNGVCINRYIGDSDYVEIPETIDGKPVLKLGVFMYQYEEHDFDYSIYEQYYSSPFLDADFYSYLIKNVKKIIKS